MPTHENGQRADADHGGALVTVIGESLVDMIDDPYRGSPEPEALPGGSPLNVAVGCARLDLRTNLITHFAEDPHGLMIAVHTGSTATMLSPGDKAVRGLIEASRAHATVSYDPNCRPAISPDVVTARQQAEDFVAVSDIVKASDEDLRWLYPDRT